MRAKPALRRGGDIDKHTLTYAGELRQFDEEEIPEATPYNAGQIQSARLVQILERRPGRTFTLVLEWQPDVPMGMFDDDNRMSSMRYAPYGTIAVCLEEFSSSVSVAYGEMSYAEALEGYLQAIMLWMRGALYALDELDRSIQDKNGFTVVKPP